MGFISGMRSAFSPKPSNPYLDKELARGSDIWGYILSEGDKEYVKMNPDEVIRRKGMRVYKEMRADEQVKAALFVKKFARLSTGWSIVPPDNPSATEKKATAFCQDVLYNAGSSKILKGIMTALDFGYSIGEKIYTISDSGRWKGKIIITKIKSKAPENYEFKLDAYDNIEGLVPVAGYAAGGYTKDKPLPIDKFIIYSYNQEFENPYGNSDLRGAYNAWWMKHLFQKFMSIYYERFGIPTAVGTYGEYAADDTKKTLEEALDSIQSKTSVSIPEKVKIDLLEVAKEKGDVWTKAIEHLDARICRSVLIPSLLGFSNQNFGSYALGKSQMQVFLYVLQELGNEIADDVVNPQIIKPLCDYNFSVERKPKFRFNNFTKENIHQLLQVWNNMAKDGIVERVDSDEDFIRDVIGLPNKDSGNIIPGKTKDDSQIITPDDK